MVTAFEILAKVFSRLGDFQVQAFPAFGVERTGAPIQAFLRVAKHAIFNRSNIYTPHLVVIFDESLVEQVPVSQGLKEQGAILINTERPAQAFHHLCPRVYTVPATRLSLELGLGSKALPIVNAAMIGAIMRIFNGDMEVAGDMIRKNVPAKEDANVRSAELAFDKVVAEGINNKYLLEVLNADMAHDIEVNNGSEFQERAEPEGLFAPFWSVPMSANKTGNWRLLTPEYADRTPPCNSNCPAGTDVRAFVKKVSEEKFEEAFDILYKHNPFPGVCGRVCPHFCEQNCNRNSFDQGLNIGAIERYLGDRFTSDLPEEVPVTRDQSVAVIGAGPAGLTAALRLREKGYEVAVFEALPVAGGMMRSGIPKFRLPDDVLDREIARIEARGVKIYCDHKVSLIELEGAYDVAIAAVGSHVSRNIGVDNEHLLKEGIEFLREFKLNGDRAGIEVGDRIAIIGGGNTAIDVARTALRLGAVPTIYYRRTIKEMPAIAEEVEEALKEGVQIEFLTAPNAIAKSGESLEIEFVRMKLGDPDDSGRRRPVPIEGSEYVISAEHVVSATGQKYDHFVFGHDEIKPVQGRTEYDWPLPLFCAGDMAWGGTVTEAIGSGNKVAAEVHAWLQGKPYTHEEDVPEVVVPDDINFNYYLPSPRHRAREHHPEKLLNDFSEVTEAMPVEEVVAESTRCLHCGDCYDCGNCLNFCPDSAISVDEHGRLRIDYDYCKGCGICLYECPCSAIQYSISQEVVTS